MANPLIGLIGSTKAQIIECLEEKHLTIKELHAKLKSQGKNISYQATHKAITEMIKEEVLKTCFFCNFINGAKNICLRSGAKVSTADWCPEFDLEDKLYNKLCAKANERADKLFKERWDKANWW